MHLRRTSAAEGKVRALLEEAHDHKPQEGAHSLSGTLQDHVENHPRVSSGTLCSSEPSIKGLHFIAQRVLCNTITHMHAVILAGRPIRSSSWCMQILLTR